MTDILWHGRGGQGAFTAARLLGAGYALQDDANFALAFPSFGPERRGAPVRAFTKLAKRPIGDRSEIERADYSIYLDDTLFSKEAFAALKPGGRILLNTARSVRDPRVIALNGSLLAEEILNLQIVNTVMLGAFAGIFDGVSVDALEEAVRRGMPPKLQEKYIAVIRAAAQKIRKEIAE